MKFKFLRNYYFSDGDNSNKVVDNNGLDSNDSNKIVDNNGRDSDSGCYKNHIKLLIMLVVN